MHGGCPQDEKKICHLCFQDPDTVTPVKIYTRKYLVMMETPIADFHTSFYILEIQKIALHFPCVRIIGTNHCGNTLRKEFKHCSENPDVLCHRDYAERVVISFAHHIQSEYYGGNESVYIQGIVLENSIVQTLIETAGALQACTHHDVFHSLLSDDNKQYSATTIAHSKQIIELLKQHNIMSNVLSTIW